MACINKAMGSPTIICMTKGRGHSHRRQRELSVPHITHVGKAQMKYVYMLHMCGGAKTEK